MLMVVRVIDGLSFYFYCIASKIGVNHRVVITIEIIIPIWQRLQ